LEEEKGIIRLVPGCGRVENALIQHRTRRERVRRVGLVRDERTGRDIRVVPVAVSAISQREVSESGREQDRNAGRVVERFRRGELGILDGENVLATGQEKERSRRIHRQRAAASALSIVDS